MKAEYICHMGNDLFVANCARVSMDKWHDEFIPGHHMGADERLIKSLARDNHWAPYSHCKVSIRLTVPICITRQLQKHMIGAEWGHEVTDWSEKSARYVVQNEFWIPDEFRSQPPDVKQGSGPPCKNQPELMAEYLASCRAAFQSYRTLLEKGVCREQARAVLPQSTYTQWIWTGSLAFWARVYKLRVDDHAQKEAGQIAQMIANIVQPLFPVSWDALIGDKEASVESA